MRKWILANQAEKTGRLYWSVGRGWTYLELAKLYAEPTRETIQEQPIGAKPIWFEVEVSANSFRKVLDTFSEAFPHQPDRTFVVDIPAQERPHFPGGKDLLNAIGDLENRTAVFTPRAGQGSRFAGIVPDRIDINRGYNINFYLKAAS
jgi:hypothetical protein